MKTLALRSLRNALLLSCLPLITLAAIPPPTLPIAKEFKSKNLGIFDVSTDGTLLLMHQQGKSDFNKKRTFTLHVLHATGYRALSSIEMEVPNEFGRDDSFASSRQAFFMPNSHRVVLVGKTRNSKDEPSLMIWNPENGGLERIPDVLKERTYIANAWDSDRILYYTVDAGSKEAIALMHGRKFFTYRLSTHKAEAVDIRDDEYRFGSDPPIARNPERTKILAKIDGAMNRLEIRDVSRVSAQPFAVPSDREISNYGYSPDGRYLVVLSVQRPVVAGTENGTHDRTDVPFVSIYDTVSGQVRDQQILDYVHPYSKKVFKLPEAEDYLVSTGEQMRFSHDGRRLAVSFCVGSRSTGRQVAQFAVFDFPSLELLGVVQHPRMKIGVFEYVGTSAVGGRLRFSPDDRLLFTTSKFTIASSVP